MLYFKHMRGSDSYFLNVSEPMLYFKHVSLRSL